MLGGDRDWPKECAIVIDTWFNGGGLRIYARLRKYIGDPESNIIKRQFLKQMELVKMSDWESRMSRFPNGGSNTYLVGGTSKPEFFRLIRGKSYLLLRIDIIKKLDMAVNSGVNQSNGGRSEWRRMTSNEKHRWYFL